MNELSKRLKALRKAHGLSQKQLSELIGVTQAYMSELEKGKKRPSLEVLKNLCNTLGCSADYLLDITGKKNYSVLKEEGPGGGLNSKMLSEALKKISEEDLLVALKVAQVIREEKK